MIKINFSIRPFVKPNGQVAVRARWNSKRYEVTFITGAYADASKWDDELRKAKHGTTHVVRNMSFTYCDINGRIADFKQTIEEAFAKCSLANTMPTASELKSMVNKALGRNEHEEATPEEVKKKNMKQMIAWFLDECGRE